MMCSILFICLNCFHSSDSAAAWISTVPVSMSVSVEVTKFSGNRTESTTAEVGTSTPSVNSVSTDSSPVPTEITTFGVNDNETSTNPTIETTSTATLNTTTISLGKDFSLEFENGLSPSQLDKYMIYRSEASGKKTLHLKDSDVYRSFSAKLCVEGMENDTDVVIQVIGLLYSNDGPSDEILFTLDGNSLGNVSTKEFYNGGEEWNVFKNTGPIGGAVALANGNHTLSMTALTDQWGAEFDSLIIRAQNQNPGVELLCDAELL